MAPRPDNIVSLTEDADQRSLISDRTYERALILGPTVMAPQGCSFIDCAFSGDPESLFIEVPEGKRAQGIVAAQNVTFRDCRFENVALIGTRQFVDEFKTGLAAPRNQPLPANLSTTGVTASVPSPAPAHPAAEPVRD